eukprot:scaffold8850_cov72-Phaeocystis_antarctica.AAC.14
MASDSALTHAHSLPDVARAQKPHSSAPAAASSLSSRTSSRALRGGRSPTCPASARASPASAR